MRVVPGGWLAHASLHFPAVNVSEKYRHSGRSLRLWLEGTAQPSTLPQRSKSNCFWRGVNPTANFTTVDNIRLLFLENIKFGLIKFKSSLWQFGPKSFLNTPGALEPLKRSKVIIKAVQFWSIVLLAHNPTWLGRSQWSQLTKPATFSSLSGGCPKNFVIYTETYGNHFWRSTATLSLPWQKGDGIDERLKNGWWCWRFRGMMII